MRRSQPLQRRAPLRSRREPLKAYTGLQRTAPKARPRKPPTPPELAARREAWMVAVTKGAACLLCGRKRPRPLGHHAPRRQLIERLGGDPWDPRCGIPICKGCHDDHHALGVTDRRIPRRLLPAAVWAFARELGEEAIVALEREYPT